MFYYLHSGIYLPCMLFGFDNESDKAVSQKVVLSTPLTCENKLFFFPHSDQSRTNIFLLKNQGHPEDKYNNF